MKIISVFNNKGGVGKSTLTYHVGCSLSELGYKVLLVDLDPQCNLTLCSMGEDELHKIWKEEDDYIDNLENINLDGGILDKPRSIHFLLKPVEDGMNDFEHLPTPYNIDTNIDIIPGRLSLHKFENKIAERWSGMYQSDNLAIRTITSIRTLCSKYAKTHEYNVILVDTSPSLGILNKVIISTVDGFFIPAQPDMFSLYGIRNIGSSLEVWQKEFDAIYTLISEKNRAKFPNKFVQFLGYTIYNSKKYTNSKSTTPANKYNLAQAHYQYVLRIPSTIQEFIKNPNRINVQNIDEPIGGESIIHTHNTFPAMAQALKCPMWKVPEKYTEFQSSKPEYIQFLKENGFEYNRGNNGRLQSLKHNYEDFTRDLIDRIRAIDR